MENSNQSAFPLGMDVVENSGPNTNAIGLTKREYFAAMAMQGLIANAPSDNLHNTGEGSALAVAWADELLKQLK